MNMDLFPIELNSEDYYDGRRAKWLNRLTPELFTQLPDTFCIEDLASILNLSPSTIRNYIYRHHLRPVRQVVHQGIRKNYYHKAIFNL